MALSLTAWAVCSFALELEQAETFERELLAIASLKPAYVWGGVDETKGVDCSGYMYRAAKRAGILGVKRTTSIRMSEGRDGWLSTIIQSVWDVNRGDLVWWTWKGSDRREGHVGAVVGGHKSNLLECAHASSKNKSVVVVPFRGQMITDLDLIRRLK